MRTLFLIAVLLFLPITAGASGDLMESKFTFQEQVGDYSSYDWRVHASVPEGYKCTVTAFIVDHEGRLMLKAVGPVLERDAIFGQPVSVPTAQTAKWFKLHTSIGCVKE